MTEVFGTLVIQGKPLRPPSTRVVGLSRDCRMAILENGLGNLCLMPVDFLIPAERETLDDFENLRIIRNLK